jgi:hypothetical protein
MYWEIKNGQCVGRYGVCKWLLRSTSKQKLVRVTVDPEAVSRLIPNQGKNIIHQ